MANNSSVLFSTYNPMPIYNATQQRNNLQTSGARSKQGREYPDSHSLSYYESSIPNESNHFPPSTTPTPESTSQKPSTPPIRKLSITSDSSSDYSEDSNTNDAARDTATTGSELETSSSTTTRRLGTPSKGGADRRRVAIVQMDDSTSTSLGGSSSASTTQQQHSIRSRRGHKSNLAGLALVAPPDAAVRSYTHFTPPLTAPPTGGTDFGQQSLLTARRTPLDKGHHRSASENVKGPSTSRDVLGMMNTSHGMHPSHNNIGTRPSSERDHQTLTFTQQQQHDDRSSSPARNPSYRRFDRPPLSHGHKLPPTPTSNSGRLASSMDMYSPPLITPEIGQGKEIHVPVAGPVVFSLDDLEAKKMSTHHDTPTPSPPLIHDTPTTSTPYIRFQPALSSPLSSSSSSASPSPNKTAFTELAASPPPPRPPRLHSPQPPRARGDTDSVKQPLHIPAYAASTTSTRSDSKKSLAADETIGENTSSSGSLDKDVDQPLPATASHRREGASAFVSESQQHSQTSKSPNDIPPVKQNERPKTAPERSDTLSSDIPSLTVVGPSSSSTSSQNLPPPDIRKFEEWLDAHPEFQASTEPPSTPSHKIRRSVDEPRKAAAVQAQRPLSPISPEVTGEAPNPPPKGFRNSFTSSLKRFSSLPRSPSRSSASASTSRSGRPGSVGTQHSSRTPSPSIYLHGPSLGRASSFQKIKSTNPAAMYCHEVYGGRTTAERCAIYAGKINELYLYDCGLSDWVLEMKYRGSNSPSQRAPSTVPFTPQPRQTSRSSIISEATFPRRPDASTATDLLQGAFDDLKSPTFPPTLPYPSLAINPPPRNPGSSANSHSGHSAIRSNTSVGSGTTMTPPSSVRSLVPTHTINLKGTGFFASLGRKASLSSGRRDSKAPTLLSVSGSTSSSGGGGGGMKVPPQLGSLAISRPINITNPPSIPGGPRAPRRPQRSQTLMTTSNPFSPTSPTKLSKRPSMFEFSLDTVVGMQNVDNDFAQQVEKLQMLLPHVDRNVLAGYLRYAGQDMLAIGQYLEDERMGTVKHF